MPQTSQQLNLAMIGMPYKNLGRVSFAQWVAESEASTSFAASLLGNGEPAETWRSTSVLGSKTIIGLHFDDTGGGLFSRSLDIGGVAISNHNLTPNYGQYRIFVLDFIGASEATDPFQGMILSVYPDTLAGTVNTSGVVGDIDETGDPDGVAPNTGMLYPTSFASDYEGRIQFATPVYNGTTIETTNTDKRQEFWFFVRTGSATTNSDFAYTEAPTITVELYEDGVSVRNLGTKIITKGGSGQWVCFTWNGSEVVDLSKVEAYFYCDHRTVDAVNVNVKIDTVRWRSEDANWTAFYDYDSGWLTFEDVLSQSDLIAQSGMQRTLFRALELGTITKPGIFVAFRDDQVPSDFSFSSSEWVDPVGYVEAGSMDVGKLWQATINFTSGDLLSGKYLTEVRETQGGQEYGTSLRTRRMLRIPHEFLTSSEGSLLIDRSYRVGPLYSFFVHAYPLIDGAEGQILALPCTCPEPPSYAVHLRAADYPRAVGLQLKEKF